VSLHTTQWVLNVQAVTQITSSIVVTNDVNKTKTTEPETKSETETGPIPRPIMPTVNSKTNYIIRITNNTAFLQTVSKSEQIK